MGEIMALNILNMEQQHRKNVDNILMRLSRLPKKYTEEVMIELGISRTPSIKALKEPLTQHNAERVYLIERALARIEKQRRTRGINYR